MNKLMMILLTSLSVSSAFGQYKDENLLLFGNFNEKWEVYCQRSSTDFVLLNRNGGFNKSVFKKFLQV